MQPFISTGRRILASNIPLRGSHSWDWYYRAKEAQKVQKKPSTLWDNKENKRRTKVYFDIGSENKETQRIEIELLDDIVPRTVENFVNLVNGTNGLKYKDCGFFDIRKDEFVCTGAVKGEKRLGGYSSFGRQYFDDENFIAQTTKEFLIINHDIPGVLTMVNAGTHKNNSIFAISLKPLPHLDGRNVVFGHVTKGFENVVALSKVFCYKGVPLDPVVIKACGILSS